MYRFNLSGCNNRIYSGFIVLLAVFGVTLSPSAIAQGTQYEQPPVFRASSFLPQEMQAGTSYKLKEQVGTQGMLYSFELWSRYGWYHPESLDMLRIRLAEIRALDTLTSMQQDPLFLEGVGDQMKGTVESTVDAVKHPFRTLADVPLGLEKFGRQVGAKMEEGDTLPDENIRGIHEEAKRKLAVSLGVDPYTDNQLLQNALNDVATNKNRGALLGRAGTAFIPAVGPALSAAHLNKGLQDRLANLTSAELQQETRNTLSALGAPRVEVDRFMSNPGYTPTTRAVIAEALAGLRGVSGVQDTLRMIQVVPSREVAHFYQRRVQLAESFHRSARPLDKMVAVGATPVFVDKEGTTVIAAPVDFLYWNEDLARRVQLVKNKIGDRKCELYITGTASDLAKQNLASAGVSVHEKAGTN
jgi:DNA-binding transcriptional regulator/RsmH inhibitor MraZ